MTVPRCSHTIRPLGLIAPLLLVLALAGSASAASFAPFGPTGAGGALNGQAFTLGSGGAVFELDAFVRSGTGPATALSSAPTVAQLGGLSITLDATLSTDGTDVLLTYTVANTGVGAVDDVRFISYLDAEIDAPTNTFFNEYVTTRGAPAAGQGFEVDEPGFRIPPGDIYANASAGALDGSNAHGSPANADDVAMGLQFDIASIAAGDSTILEILVSEDMDFLGPFALDQRDIDPRSTDVISYSGRVRPSDPGPGPQVPEPSSALLLAIGGLVVRSRIRRPSNRRR